MSFPYFYNENFFLIDPRAILFGKSFNDDDETEDEDNGMVGKSADKKTEQSNLRKFSRNENSFEMAKHRSD